jgi:hypothetical protein
VTEQVQDALGIDYPAPKLNFDLEETCEIENMNDTKSTF